MNDASFDLSQYNDIDPALIQYLIDHYDDAPHAEEIIDALHGAMRDRGNQFSSLANLSDPAMARMALQMGMTIGEGGLERPWAVIYNGDVQTVEAARELVKFAGISPHYFTLTKEPSIEVARELGKTHPAVLELGFIPSQSILTALNPGGRVEINVAIDNAQQLEPLVGWLSEDEDRDLMVRGTIPAELKQALKMRFPYQLYL